MLGGCKHARSTNLHFKTLKNIKKNKKIEAVSSLNWGVFTPPPLWALNKHPH